MFWLVTYLVVACLVESVNRDRMHPRTARGHMQGIGVALLWLPLLLRELYRAYAHHRKKRRG